MKECDSLNILKKIPLPITGVSLAFAALGNLVQVTPLMSKSLALFSYIESFSLTLRFILNFISLIIFIVISLKIILNFSGFKTEMENPIIASVFPTYSMNLMLLATWLGSYFPSFASILWYFAIGLHILLIIYFSVKFLFKFDLQKVFPSWFIVYVGIAVASVTAGSFKNLLLGQICFYWGIIWTIIIFCLLIYRQSKKFKLKEPAKPLVVICCAPLALCLAGYINSFTVKNIITIWIMILVSQIIFVAILLRLISFLRLQFYPSFSAFTFPIVISGLSAKLALHALFEKANFILQSWIILIETIIAFLVVFYVLVKYIQAILKSEKN